ncbi:CAAX prenyl protease [Characodon lateralis]|uniref:CAAX prenyl protease n=1 Tax=Characodon lateralis TaxID=208331 RepID=A0ABU7EXA5_9TELE|nr:CAAX prenyl protease [Characodon lateralis]
MGKACSDHSANKQAFLSRSACLSRCFQAPVWNANNAGHLMGPVLCHSFCNYMGFPAISTALEHPQRLVILSSYLFGVLLFFMLLFPLTDPSYYGAPTPVCTLTSSPSCLCFS